MAQDKIFAGIGGNTSIFTFNDKLYIQDGLDIFVNGGTLDVSNDTDVAVTLGRGKIGYDESNSDFFVLGHFDHFNSTDYMIRQRDNGQIDINIPTGQSMQFKVNNSTKMTLDQNGNLSQRPDEDATDTFGRCKIGYDGTNSDSFIISHFDNFNTTDYLIRQTQDGRAFINAKTGQLITFRINNAEKMRIDADGNVGIGRAPTGTAYALDAYKSSGQIIIGLETDSLAAAESARLIVEGKKSGGSSRFAQIGIIYYDQSSSGGSNEPCGYIRLSEGDGSNAYFWVDNSQNFRISNTSTNIGSTNGTVVGTQTSDIRVKNVIDNLNYGLNEVMQMNPIEYTYKYDKEQINHVGFSAQEIINIIPEAVYDTKEIIDDSGNTKLAMDYDEIIPVLVNAIKELKQEINELKRN